MSHKYKVMEREEMELVLSTFLIDSWSYSKVTSFARNQKAFEMEYIYGLWGKQSASGIAGKGYHKALDYFFTEHKDGVLVELPELQQAAYDKIASVPANQWKLSKTLPTMEEVVGQALKIVTKALQSFCEEKSIYLDEMDEILGVELYFDEFVTVDGVDIPLPCHGLIDLVIRTKDGRVIIIDHKTTASYTDEKEAALVRGQQAIVYVLAYEAKTGESVDEVWFIENKPSENKNGEPQLQNIPIKLDKDSRALYAHLLYQNLRQMIAAVRDPDFVYTINTSDNFVDMAELLDFCMRTEICEVEDFNVDPGKKDLIKKRLAKIRNADIKMINPQIIKNFREKAASFIKYDLSVTNMTQQEKITHVLKTFGIMVEVSHSFSGYSSNTFLLSIGAGVKVDSIKKYRMDLANQLNVPAVRIGKELKIYEGKAYLPVEFAKPREETLLYNPDDRQGFKLPLGRDNYNNVIVWDLDNQSTPHMLVGGTTGSGKSVFLEALLEYAIESGVEDIIILDPKHEFKRLYGHPGIDVINDILEIEETLGRCVQQMNDRAAKGINRKCLIVFDEYADAIGRARKGEKLKVYKQVTDGNYANGNTKWKRAHVSDIDSLGDNLAMLLQKGRSSGFRVVCAAQRPSTEIIPGDAKANFPIRVAFRLPKALDSNVVLGEPGAENLTDKGDGLLISPEYRETIRFQSYYKPQHQPA